MGITNIADGEGVVPYCDLVLASLYAFDFHIGYAALLVNHTRVHDLLGLALVKEFFVAAWAVSRDGVADGIIYLPVSLI